MVDLLARIGPETAHIAHCLEQAAWHQTRALAYTREAHAPRPQPLTTAEHHALVLQALEHLVQAQQLVRQAQQASRSPAQAQVLAERLTRLQAVAASVERKPRAATARWRFSFLPPRRHRPAPHAERGSPPGYPTRSTGCRGAARLERARAAADNGRPAAAAIGDQQAGPNGA